MDVTGRGDSRTDYSYGLLALGGVAMFAFRRFAKGNSPKSVG